MKKIFILWNWDHFFLDKKRNIGDFPCGPVVKTPSFHCRGCTFNPWLGKSDPTHQTSAWPKKPSTILILFLFPFPPVSEHNSSFHGLHLLILPSCSYGILSSHVLPPAQLQDSSLTINMDTFLTSRKAPNPGLTNRLLKLLADSQPLLPTGKLWKHNQHYFCRVFFASLTWQTFPNHP